MAAIAATAVALILYAAAANEHLVFATAGAGVLTLALGLCALAGWALGHRTPGTSRWLLWCWTPAVIILSGAVGALVAYLGVRWAAGKDAPESAQIIGGLIAALLTGVGTSLGKFLQDHLTPWLAKNTLWSKYKDAFPCLPPGLGAGRSAYELLDTLHRADAARWKGPAIQDLLTTIAAAYEAGEFKGGSSPPPC